MRFSMAYFCLLCYAFGINKEAEMQIKRTQKSSHHSPLGLAHSALTLVDQGCRERKACEIICDRFAVRQRSQMIEKTCTELLRLLRKRQLEEAEQQLLNRGESWIAKFYGN